MLKIIVTFLSSFCKCLSTDHIIVDKEICFHEIVLGNGQCDDFANRKECAFDKGMFKSLTRMGTQTCISKLHENGRHLAAVTVHAVFYAHTVPC